MESFPNVNLQEGRLSSTQPFPRKENFSSQPALQATVDPSNSPAGPKSTQRKGLGRVQQEVLNEVTLYGGGGGGRQEMWEKG